MPASQRRARNDLCQNDSKVITLPCKSAVREMPRQVIGNCPGLYREKSKRKLCDTVLRIGEVEHIAHPDLFKAFTNFPGWCDA